MHLVARCPQRIPVSPVVAALEHAYACSEPAWAEDTDEDAYLEEVIHFAQMLGKRFPLEPLLPLLADERIRVRRAVIEALRLHDAAPVLVRLLTDPSAQMRRLALQQLAGRQQLTVHEAQRLALDANPRVKNAALAWLQRQAPAGQAEPPRSQL